jgi:hypothetical protein
MNGVSALGDGGGSAVGVLLRRLDVVVLRVEVAAVVVDIFNGGRSSGGAGGGTVEMTVIGRVVRKE